jgi:hypothetical protein
MSGDDFELHLQRRKGDWRIVLPNGKIVLCNTERDAGCSIEGILIGRIVTREMAKP